MLGTKEEQDISNASIYCRRNKHKKEWNNLLANLLATQQNNASICHCQCCRHSLGQINSAGDDRTNVLARCEYGNGIGRD